MAWKVQFCLTWLDALLSQHVSMESCPEHDQCHGRLPFNSCGLFPGLACLSFGTRHSRSPKLLPPPASGFPPGVKKTQKNKGNPRTACRQEVGGWETNVGRWVIILARACLASSSCCDAWGARTRHRNAVRSGGWQCARVDAPCRGVSFCMFRTKLC